MNTIFHFSCGASGARGEPRSVPIHRFAKTLFACATLTLHAFALPAAAGVGYDWQENGRGPAPGMPSFHTTDTQQWRYGGLCVEFTPMMRLLKRYVPCWSLPDWTSWINAGFANRHVKEYVDFGGIGPNTTEGYGRRMAAGSDWTHVKIEMRGAKSGDILAHAVISRVFPGVLLESNAGGLRLFINGFVPQYFAAPGLDGVEVYDRQTLEELNKSGRSAAFPPAWTLMWMGKDFQLKTTRHPFNNYQGPWGAQPPWDKQADCPWLLVFDDNGPPELHIRSAQSDDKTSEWLELKPDSKPLRCVLLPLFGDYYPLIEETREWVANMALPESVAALCEWWGENLGGIPYSARERYEYDSENDAISVASEFAYADFREDAQTFAPLPPMLSIAREFGFPIQIEAEPEKTSVLTYAGPYCVVPGATSVVCSVKGLGKYVLEERRPVIQSDPAAERLRQMLSAEVEKVVDAGSLAPWLYIMSGWKGLKSATYAFYRPGEVHYIMGEAMPLLDESLRKRVVEYLHREAEARPIPSPEPLKTGEGARRERYASSLPADMFEECDKDIRDTSVFYNNKMPPEISVYHLERFVKYCCADPEAAFEAAEEMLDPFMAYHDWATLGWFQFPMPYPFAQSQFEGMGGTCDVNRHFAAIVGAIRLARAANAKNEDMYWGLLARTAILRFGMEKYMRYIYAEGILDAPKNPAWMTQKTLSHGGHGGHNLYTFDFKGPEDDIQRITHMNQFGIDVADHLTHYGFSGLIHCRGLTPELGRFMNDYLKDDVNRFLARVYESMPDWYRYRPQSKFNAEIAINAPEDAYFLFLAHAWAAGTQPEKLAHYLDVPWLERGDLYYIHKLTETIKARQGWDWAAAGKEDEKLRR